MTTAQPIQGALVGLGGHDGPPNAGPALQSTTAADGSYEIDGIPQAEYPQLTVEAPAGYADAFGGAVTVGSSVVTRDLAVRRNYADNRAGGSITSDARNDAPWGCGWGNLIDGSQETALETASPDFDGDGADFVEPDVHGHALAAGQRRRGGIDPQANCYNLVDSSLAAYTLQVSTDGSTFTTVANGTFDRHSNGHLNRVATKGMPNGIRKVRLIAPCDAGHAGRPDRRRWRARAERAAGLRAAERAVRGRRRWRRAGGGPGTAQLRPDLKKAKRRQRVVNKRVSYKVRCVRATAGDLPATCRMTLTVAGSKKSFTAKPGVYKTVKLKLKAARAEAPESTTRSRRGCARRCATPARRGGRARPSASSRPKQKR